ncbi:class I adenylate-forming enzyme family protein [Rhodococcus koreensis]
MTTSTRSTVSDYFEHFATTTPSAPLVRHDGREITYGQAFTTVRQLAGALIGSGVRRGDRIAVYSNPHADTLILFLAAAQVGAIFVGLNPKQSTDELVHVLSIAEPTVAFVVGEFDASHSDKVLAAFDQLDPVPRLVGGQTQVFDRPGMDEFLRANTASDDAVAAARNSITDSDPVAMVFTSGSSGRPKGALLTSGPMMRSYAAQAEHWYRRAPRGVADLPINHLGFIGDNCMAVLAGGGSVSIIPRWSPEAVLETIERDRLNFWWTQTTMLLLATRSERWASTDFSSLDLIGFAGAPLNDEMLVALRATGLPLVTGYGMTEVHGNVTYTDPGDPLPVTQETVGRPHPGFDVQVVDDEGTELPAGEVGEVVIKSPSLFGGYRAADGSIDPAVDGNGYYHTNDLAYVRDDGCLVLAGRKDAMFKSGGYNVYPQEVERALESHPQVANAIVTAVPDPTWGQVGHAFVKYRGSTTPEASELVTYLSELLANYKIPKQIVALNDLPMTPSGKIDRRQIASRASIAPAAQTTT